jgi:autotransporter passenger strand-loop-strand repeat protein
VTSGATVELGSGVTFNTVTVSAGITEKVLSGGTISNLTIDSGGLGVVASGGTVSSATVSNGGTLELFATPTTSLIVASGGTLEIGSGYSHSGFVVGTGVTEEVLTGGTEQAATITGGTQLVYGLASGGTLSSGELLIESGGTAQSTIIKGGIEIVVAGGTDQNAQISGGVQDIYGVGSGASITSGGQVVVFAGGSAIDTTVGNSGSLTVSSGGFAVDTTVMSGGTVDVLSGGTLDTASGGTVIISGTVNNSGTMAADKANSLLEIASGASVTGVVEVGNGIVDIVASGGEAISFLSNGIGGLEIADKAGATSAYSGTISGFGGLAHSNKFQYIDLTSVSYVAGTITDSYSAGVLTVSSAGTTVATIDIAGSYVTSNFHVGSGAGGTVEITDPASVATVSSGGIAGGKTIEGGTLEITSGGSAGGRVTFAANSGTLLLDHSTTFSGTVAGMTGQDTLDLRDINFATATFTSAGTTASSTLAITDGAHTAHILLLGNYMASTFTLSNDGFNGTSIVDPHVSASQTVSLAQTHNG